MVWASFLSRTTSSSSSLLFFFWATRARARALLLLFKENLKKDEVSGKHYYYYCYRHCHNKSYGHRSTYKRAQVTLTLAYGKQINLFGISEYFLLCIFVFILAAYTDVCLPSRMFSFLSLGAVENAWVIIQCRNKTQPLRIWSYILTNVTHQQ